MSFVGIFVKQLEKQRRTDQELKKKVLKLEFCLQEARNQTRKLHRVIPIQSVKLLHPLVLLMCSIC